MTKINEKIHVLTDESLGRIKREYVEVDRKADVGDRVVADGDYREVVAISSRRGICLDGDICLGIPHSYRTLEPTSIVHIDGERYKMVDRKAKVGEKVIITERVDFYMDDMTVGKVYEVINISGEEDVEVMDDTEEKATASKSGYLSLVSLTKENKHQKPKAKTRGYKEVKNLIHHELSITRQDIQEMINVAVINEIKKMSEAGEFYKIASSKIDSIIKDGFSDRGNLLYGFKERVSQTISDEVGKRIANNLNINVELKNQ
ncbi:hypothetical protein P4T89_12775 [Bacillus nakamurai]|uniref:Uncharacterized protein n=1 Tax=Bacillus nakamurai TaxID=1793963 RepID=A0A150FAZ3_9BACI|nr:hypothetical protein [Bacillus nakamurai]KXZ22386.1 hypothetical protein AXI58_10370 [Bacillus nakamurai]MED1228390.1 hypothetical protein [Bacillus nakamurai]